ncbi:zf-HC2 domain-containing protein [Streptomyces sp. NBC_01808]|uniref:anti-sigma factor family protein n=1 Tax=Streptomyces sp. NBC_01808 TaxID=2975947 RepID=UPI002DDB08CB|nr:zf-HC2 domain-containing protein [Streptomyces sp. NBC_01808]WSA40309.1 zf-HC2 domain-containing protein [Streptomyces sp. NBC_01808]
MEERKSEVRQVSCDEFVELVTAFLDGAMDEPAELRFLVHLSRCGDCETYLEQVKQTVAMLGELPETRLTTETRDHLRCVFRSLRQG